jgi:ribonuclease HI
VKEIKFLGMILDSKLSWRHHIDMILSRCEKNMNILRAVCRVWWGCHPKTMKILYNALVRSHLDYGSFLMDPLPKYLQAKFDLVQSKCLRLILGAMRSSPVNALQVESVDMPLQLRRRYLSDNFLLKRTGFDNLINESVSTLNALDRCDGENMKIPNLCKSLRTLYNFDSLPPKLTLLPYYNTPFEAITFSPHIILDTGITKGLTNKEYIRSKFLDFTEKFPSHTHIFTDGSKFHTSPDVGVGIYISQLNIKVSYKIPGPASIFTAECIAIREALNLISSVNISHCILFTDSLSALKAISSNLSKRSGDHVLCDIKKILYSLHVSKKEVIITWIPAHMATRS